MSTFSREGKFKSLFLCLAALFCIETGMAQITEDSLTNSVIPELDLVLPAKKEEKKAPKVKKKKNIYQGTKIKKQFTKAGSGSRQIIELFYYVREYKEPNPYVQEVFWYDTKKKIISKSKNIDKSTMRPLHGPYKKMVGGKLVEEGFYYMGSKHERWEQYNANFILLDKTKYNRGWLEESKITYYDADRTKIKEVIPIEFGVKKGKYYSFYDGGQLEMEGQYDNDIKVGKWIEYYQFRRRKKKEIQFSPDPFDKNFESYVIKEWDEKGTLLFDKEAEEKKSLSKF
jgi:antitoxin component YwqK of YwqJK toxin-antitoxin module